jgi:hypothetical protein
MRFIGITDNRTYRFPHMNPAEMARDPYTLELDTSLQAVATLLYELKELREPKVRTFFFGLIKRVDHERSDYVDRFICELDKVRRSLSERGYV